MCKKCKYLYKFVHMYVCQWPYMQLHINQKFKFIFAIKVNKRRGAGCDLTNWFGKIHFLFSTANEKFEEKNITDKEIPQNIITIVTHAHTKSRWRRVDANGRNCGLRLHLFRQTAAVKDCGCCLLLLPFNCIFICFRFFQCGNEDRLADRNSVEGYVEFVEQVTFWLIPGFQHIFAALLFVFSCFCMHSIYSLIYLKYARAGNNIHIYPYLCGKFFLLHYLPIRRTDASLACGQVYMDAVGLWCSSFP